MIAGARFPTADEEAFLPLRINRSQAIVESRRCLYCYDAPCTRACPVHIDIPGFIKRIREENFEGSYQLLVEPNPFAAICGLACPTADLCEGACVLPGLGQRAVRIGALQYDVASSLLIPESPGELESPSRVAVIGGGPAGLSCAITLRRIGHGVDLFESRPSLGGLMEQVIPPHRLPVEVVDHDMQRLEGLGIEFHLGMRIGTRDAAGLLEEYDAIFLGMGLRDAGALSVPGVEQSGVRGALDFLEQCRRSPDGDVPRLELGECVVIVGGGNVALDAATVARRLGAPRAVVIYRRTMEEMPAWRSEYVEAASLGVEFRWLSLVSRILGSNGRVRAVQIQPMRLAGVGKDGRRGVEPDPDASPYEFPCSAVIMALGQRFDPALAEALSIPLSPQGSIAVSAGSLQTENPKVFAGGDAISGGSTVVEAIAQGMRAGHAIHNWLTEHEVPHE